MSDNERSELIHLVEEAVRETLAEQRKIATGRDSCIKTWVAAVALILSLAIPALIWAPKHEAQVNARIDRLSDRVEAHGLRPFHDGIGQQQVELARINEQLGTIRSDLKRIEVAHEELKKTISSML